MRIASYYLYEYPEFVYLALAPSVSGAFTSHLDLAPSCPLWCGCGCGAECIVYLWDISRLLYRWYLAASYMLYAISRLSLYIYIPLYPAPLLGLTRDFVKAGRCNGDGYAESKTCKTETRGGSIATT
jgi:hypothetical protein